MEGGWGMPRVGEDASRADGKMQALDPPSWLAAALARCRLCVEWWWSCVQRPASIILCVRSMQSNTWAAGSTLSRCFNGGTLLPAKVYNLSCPIHT